MLIPIIVEYKYNDNSIEVNLKDKEDCILYKYVYEYNKDNLIDNCKVYTLQTNGSYYCNKARLDRYDNITKVYINDILVDEITKNNNEYEIKSYSIKEKDTPLNTTSIMFFNDHTYRYAYANGDKKCGMKVSCVNYFDKNNRLIKTVFDDINVEKSKITYEYDDKNRIIKRTEKTHKKDINSIYTLTQNFKYDEDNDRCICNLSIESNGDNTINKTVNDLQIYTANMIEHLNFNTLEGQQLLSEYGGFFLIYADYIVLNPNNKDIGINFKYDNQSRVISKEIELNDINLDIK